MRRSELAGTGIPVSELGISCKGIGTCSFEQARQVVEAALQSGVTFFDTADSYGAGASESVLGQIVAPFRDEVVLATKFGLDAGVEAEGPRAGKRYIRTAVEASLRRLRTDYIDLYQHHRPDDSNLIEEIIAILHQLVGEGKIRAIGAVGYEPWRIVDADSAARSFSITRLSTDRTRYSLLHREPETELLPICAQSQVSILACSPLAGGLLALDAPVHDKLAPKVRERVVAIARFAAERGIFCRQVALGTIAARPGIVSVLVEALTPEQVLACSEAVTWRPTDADLQKLDSITPPGSSAL